MLCSQGESYSQSDAEQDVWNKVTHSNYSRNIPPRINSKST